MENLPLSVIQLNKLKNRVDLVARIRPTEGEVLLGSFTGDTFRLFPPTDRATILL